MEALQQWKNYDNCFEAKWISPIILFPMPFYEQIPNLIYGEPEELPREI